MKRTQKRVLQIKLEDCSENVCVTALADGEPASTVRINKSEFYETSAALYSALESRTLPEDEVGRIVGEFGSQLLGPFESFVRAADEVAFLLPETMLETPLDLLHHLGQPLFLQVAVSYRVAPLRTQDPPFKRPCTSLIISDSTADPQRAAAKVAYRLDMSPCHDAGETGPGFLHAQGAHDLLLVSAHAEVERDGSGCVGMGGELVVASDFDTIRPKLAYFDSCRLGVSNAFVAAFKQMRTNYFLAPILSNEAGESSTQTMLLFFDCVLRGIYPAAALFHTRKRLWDIYDADTFADRVWRAFPFRLYRLH